MVSCVHFSPDGTRLVTASWDKTVKIWDPSTGACLSISQEQPNRHKDDVRSVHFSPCGEKIASGGGHQFTNRDYAIRIWDGTTGEQIGSPLNGHRSAVTSVSWSHDGTRLASGSWDKTVRIWNPSTGEELCQLTDHCDWVNSVAWAPDGRRLASGSNDKTVKIWDPNTGECLRTLMGHMHFVKSVCFSPCGGHVVSGGGDRNGSKEGSIRIWDVTTGEEV